MPGLGPFTTAGDGGLHRLRERLGAGSIPLAAALFRVTVGIPLYDAEDNAVTGHCRVGFDGGLTMTMIPGDSVSFKTNSIDDVVWQDFGAATTLVVFWYIDAVLSIQPVG